MVLYAPPFSFAFNLGFSTTGESPELLVRLLGLLGTYGKRHAVS